MSMEEKVIGMVEAARVLGLPLEKVKGKCETGDLSCEKNGETWVFQTQELYDSISFFSIWDKGSNYWLGEKANLNYVFEKSEVEEAIYLGDYTMAIEGVDANEVDIEELMDKLNQYEELHPDFSRNGVDDMEEFFKSIGYDNVEASFTGYYGKVEDVLVYDFDCNTFLNQADSESKTKIYQYWDGQKWEVLDLGYINETIVKVNSDYVSLDQYDGRNWYSDSSAFAHHRVYKIREIDDVICEDKYLLHYISDYQVFIPEGKVLSLEEIKNHIEKRELEVDDYMKDIERLD